jgi:hypothetical protein
MERNQAVRQTRINVEGIFQDLGADDATGPSGTYHLIGGMYANHL